jgi:hypothetical protein
VVSVNNNNKNDNKNNKKGIFLKRKKDLLKHSSKAMHLKKKNATNKFRPAHDGMQSKGRWEDINVLERGS